MLTIEATISWTAPVELYGVLDQYSVSVENSSGASVYENMSMDASMDISITPTLMVFPFVMHTVTVSVTNGGGRTSSSSTTVTSPEAGTDM